MKKIFTILVFVLFCTSISAQITIRENVTTAVLRPAPFDSLTNFIRQRNPVDYEKYIGQKLFFLSKSKKHRQASTRQDEAEVFFTEEYRTIPINGKYDDFINGRNPSRRGVETNVYMPVMSLSKTYTANYGKIETRQESVEGKYFTILDIQGNTRLNQEYTKLENIRRIDDLAHLKVVLRNDLTNDTLYWITRKNRLPETNYYNSTPFLLVSFFEKQKDMFQGKDMVAVREMNRLVDIEKGNVLLDKLIDLHTGEAVTIQVGEVWHCYDLSLTDSENYFRQQGFLFFRNGNRELMFPIGSITQSMFISKQEHERRELEKQKTDEERIQEEKEREKRREQERIEHKKYCIDKWGERLGTSIFENRVELGMTAEMCEVAWGKPYYTNRIIVTGLAAEQWVYGWGIYLYFENGILTAIQN